MRDGIGDMGENVIYASGKIHGIVYEITQNDDGEYNTNVYSSKPRETFGALVIPKTKIFTEARLACGKAIRGNASDA